MKLVSVTSAEWHPDNSVVVIVADVEEITPGQYGTLPSTKKKIKLDNISEPDATPEVVAKALNALQMEVTHTQFKIW